MEKFKRSIKGYNKKQVNEYISSMELRASSNESTLKEKNNVLEEEILNLKRELRDYKNKEESFSKGVVKLLEMENNMQQEIENRKQMEIERINIFRAKWEEYALSLIGQYNGELLAKMDNLVADFNQSVTDAIESNLKLKNDKPFSSPDAEKLSNLCKKLGILED